MKKFLIISVCLAGLGLYGFGMNNPESTGSEGKVVVENDELQVVEFVSEPGQDVCGKGTHTHEPHLTVVLTDGLARITTPDGQSEEFNLESGSAIWFEKGIHAAVNSGKSELKVLLVYLK